MVRSISELKSKLNLVTVKTDWNEPFPEESQLLEKTKGSDFYSSMVAFVEALKASKMDKMTLTRNSIRRFGILAESCGVFLGIINDKPDYIELLFMRYESTDKRMEKFKPLLTRKQFFNKILSYDNFMEYPELLTENSKYIQLSTPKTPEGYSAKLIKLDKDLIMVKYSSDFREPVLKCLRVMDNGSTKAIEAKAEYNKDEFDAITLKVGDKTFTGESFTRLWDGIEKQDVDKYIKIKNGNRLYSLDTLTGNICITDYNTATKQTFTFDKFRKQTNGVSLCVTAEIENKCYALLDNGYIWFVTENKILDLKSYFDCEVNMDILSMSNSSKGVLISKDPTSLEIVPCYEFFNKIIMQSK